MSIKPPYIRKGSLGKKAPKQTTMQSFRAYARDTADNRTDTDKNLALHEENALLKEFAATNPLTGLAGKNALIEQISHSLAQFQRDHADYKRTTDIIHQPVYLSIDLSGFKSINDRFGHTFGDKLIKAVGQSLASHVRAGEFLAHPSGDEFGIVIANMKDISKMDEMVARIKEAVKNTSVQAHDGHFYACTASIGAHIFKIDDTVEHIMTEADMAMEADKPQNSRSAEHVIASPHPAEPNNPET